MTEAEWHHGTDPQPLLEFLRGKVSDRKLRLFSVAYCRRVWHLLEHEDSRRAVELTEQYADGLVSQQELNRACYHAQEVMFVPGNPAWKPALVATWEDAWLATHELSILPEWKWLVGHVSESLTLDLFQTQQAGVLRCIVGNPFCAVTLSPAWQTANVVALAQAIYQDRQFDTLPILADALEDAGCTNTDILNHCRQPGEHTRGCWVVDTILGKQ
jgi:hypothetical protein